MRGIQRAHREARRRHDRGERRGRCRAETGAGGQDVLHEDGAPALVGVLAGERERTEHTHEEQRYDRHPETARAARRDRLRGRRVRGQRAVDRGAGQHRHQQDCRERHPGRRPEGVRGAGAEAGHDDSRGEHRAGAGDDRPAGALLGTSADGVHGDVDRAAGHTHTGQPRAQSDEAAGRDGRGDARSAQGDHREGRAPQPPTVQCPTGQEHRRQRARADEQQRGAQLGVVETGLVPHAGHRRTPGAPERAEDDGREVGGRDQLSVRRRGCHRGTLSSRRPQGESVRRVQVAASVVTRTWSGSPAAPSSRPNSQAYPGATLIEPTSGPYSRTIRKVRPWSQLTRS